MARSRLRARLYGAHLYTAPKGTVKKLKRDKISSIPERTWSEMFGFQLGGRVTEKRITSVAIQMRYKARDQGLYTGKDDKPPWDIVAVVGFGRKCRVVLMNKKVV